MHHRRSCPYHVRPPRRFNSDSKAWMGPVFAKEKNSGWNKLNAVKACTRCRDRHVRCSLRTSGGPCNHCRKRKEVCVVLGWEMQPDDPTIVIYKPVLPPPRIPSATPIEPQNDAASHSTPINAEELAGRLEKLSPRALALLWPWGPDDRDPFYPSGPQFGDDYHEHCSEDCPTRNLSAGNTAHHLYSPTNQSPSPLWISGVSPAATTSGYSYLTSSPQWEMVEDDVELFGSQEREQKMKSDRMSLNFILADESPSLSSIRRRSHPYLGPLNSMTGWSNIKPRLPSLRQALGADFQDNLLPNTQ